MCARCFCFYGSGPREGRFATTVAVGAFGRHGATQDLAQRGVGRSGRESVMTMKWFRWNVVGPPEWEREAMGSVVWVQCAKLYRECVLNLSIAVPADMGPVRVGHTVSQQY